MGQALLNGKFYLIVIGAALVLMLVAACGSDDSPDSDAAGTWSNLSAVRGTLASSRGGSNSNTGIWVNGRGNASGAPDLAIVNLGVEALADTAAEARADAAVAIDWAIAVLRASGVADPDIQTRFFNISPRYTTVEVTKCLDDVEEPVASPSSAPNSAEAMVRQEKPRPECSVVFERKLIGYQVTNKLTVKVRDLDSVGEIIDGVTESAGNFTRVDGIDFAIEDSKELQDEARAAAIEDLQDKARQVAALAGVELGRLVFISESGGTSPVPSARFESDSFAGVAQATSIQAGELDVVVSVQGVFEIGNPVP